MRIYAKLEGQNPGGSSKDRIALEDDRAGRGATACSRPGATILEPSSGNTGIGLALVAKLRGLQAARRDARERRVERRQLLEIFGAEVTLEPRRGGQQRRDPSRREDRGRRPDYVFLFQYGNPANPLAHYEGTGPEIWRDCPEVDVFVAGLGTSGTLMGVGRYLKEQKPEVQVVAVEPPAGELVQGLRNLDDGFVPPIFDPDVLDRKFIVRNRESIEWTRRLLDECGVFAGISSGAAVAGAAKIAAGDGVGHDRDAAARRRVEVPLVGRVDRRPRRRRGTRHPHQLLVSRAVTGHRARGRASLAARRARRVPDRDGLRPRRRRRRTTRRSRGCSR